MKSFHPSAPTTLIIIKHHNKSIMRGRPSSSVNSCFIEDMRTLFKLLNVFKFALILIIIELSCLIKRADCLSPVSSFIRPKGPQQRFPEDEVVHVVFSAHGNHSVPASEIQVLQSLVYQQKLQKQQISLKQASTHPTASFPSPSHSAASNQSASSSSSSNFKSSDSIRSNSTKLLRAPQKSLVSAIAFMLAKHLERENRISNNETKVLKEAANRTKSNRDEDLNTAESSILSTITAKNLANWLKDSLLGSKWRRKQPDSDYDNSDVYMVAPPGSHQFPPEAMQPGHPALAPPGHYGHHAPPPFIPPPDGFPSPYSPDSVLLPPELMQDTGIEYWLNFIEHAAHQNEQEAARKKMQMYDDYDHQSEPASVGIGEKPKKMGPNSIRDELMLDGSESDPENPETHDPDRGGNRHRQPAMSPSSAATATSSEKVTDNSAPRCDKFTPHICVDDFEYPEQAIVDEIYKRREIFELMYSDDGSKSDNPMVDGIPRDVEESFVYETYESEDSNGVSASNLKSSKVSGYICPSEVLYGKPKLARNVNGDWKVIVNAVSLFLLRTS